MWTFFSNRSFIIVIKQYIYSDSSIFCLNSFECVRNLNFLRILYNIIVMKKQTATYYNSSIFYLLDTFNYVSKFVGFFVTKSNDTFLRRSLRETVFFCFLLYALYCTTIVELMCIKAFNFSVDLKKLILFVVSQLANLSPIGCLLFFRFCDLAIWKIVLKAKNLEENLIFCGIILKIRRIAFCGMCYWVVHFIIVLGTMYIFFWPNMIFFVVDVINIFFWEAWVTIPYLQFTVWIWFLSYVLYRAQYKIIEIIELECLTSLDFCRIKNMLGRLASNDYELSKVKRIKRIVAVLKQVLSLSKELSSTYGITVLFYIANYLSRLIMQFYDVIDENSQLFSLRMIAWNIILRIVFLLPIFICCEQLSYNVNKTVKLIQEIVTLYQPSCLDCVFQSLSLRLQHQDITIQICGFLNITYRSLLTIMTTGLTFLLLQLQF